MDQIAARRLARVREAMTEWGADILALNFGPDFRYLTGMAAPLYYTILKGHGDWITSVIVSHDHDPVLVLHPWFDVDVETWVEDVRVMPNDGDPQVFLASVLAEFSPDHKTIATGKMLWGQTLLALQHAAPHARFITADNTMMDRMRAIKDADELALLQRAATIADIALAETIAHMRPGMTERDVAIEVEYQIRLAGGDGPSFPAGIIAVGNGSDPRRHIFTRNTDITLEPGMTVAFDFGSLYQGYCSDFGRSVFIGEPHPEALAAYEAITSGNLALMPALRDGQTPQPRSPTSCATTSPRAASATTTSTKGWGTPSGWRSTRSRGCGRRMTSRSPTTWSSPWNRKSGTPASITCAAKIWWSSARMAHVL